MSKLATKPATAADWKDIETVFAGCGDASRCWCAWWRKPRAEFRAGYGAANKRFFKNLVETSPHPLGVLAYRDGEPAGWCAVAPRADHSRFERSNLLAPVDGVPVWSITCFVIHKAHRGAGLMRPLIAAAVKLTKRHRAPAVEGYPIDPIRGLGSGEVFTGLPGPFADQGFVEVARRSPIRPIMRLDLTRKT